MLRPSSIAVVLALGTRAWAQPTPPAGGAPAVPPEPAPEAKPDAPTEPPDALVQPAHVQPTAPDDGKPATKLEPVAAIPPAPPAANPNRGFRFGSYGRVSAGTDTRGGKAERLLIVGHGPRIVEPSYLELEFSYGFDKLKAGESTIVMRPVITLAFNDTLFHETGQFDAQPALRNMFLDASVRPDLTLWAGSRMYRGDDIYLFDYWPLDDINTLGAGAQFSPTVVTHAATTDGAPPLEDKLYLAAHVGFNRLLNNFQFQQIEVANPVQGATTVEQLNRQRIIASATAGYTMLPTTENGMGMKAKVHAEFHSLPAGTRKRDDGTFEALPHDTGFLIGAEAGVFGFADRATGYRRHLNVFARYAKGLAAFDELAPPTTFGPDLKTNRANELTFGLSGNWDHKLGQLMLGALSRRFTDADQDTTDPDDGWEYAIDARPLVRVLPDWFVGADVSYQARFPKGLNPITLRAEDPALFEIAPIIAYSPMGPSAYDRPQLRLVYRYAHLNQAALDLYVPDDPRHAHASVSYIGVQAEWWFNSTTYR